MAIVKRIVCLANSRKMQGSCIVGLEQLEGGTIGSWVRPVSAREHEEVSFDERRLESGEEPSVLDIIDVSVLEALPKFYQTENWLLDPTSRWRLVGRVDPARLSGLVEPLAPLWINGHSSNEGTNDRIPVADAEALRNSVRLIRVARAVMRVTENQNRRRLRLFFRHAGGEYGLRPTDPEYEDRYLSREVGEYEIGECYLTISLGEPFAAFEGAPIYVYKLIAAIIETAEIRSTR